MINQEQVANLINEAVDEIDSGAEPMEDMLADMAEFRIEHESKTENE